jgi:hypothetical protein
MATMLHRPQSQYKMPVSGRSLHSMVGRLDDARPIVVLKCTRRAAGRELPVEPPLAARCTHPDMISGTAVPLQCCQPRGHLWRREYSSQRSTSCSLRSAVSVSGLRLLCVHLCDMASVEVAGLVAGRICLQGCSTVQDLCNRINSLRGMKLSKMIHRGIVLVPVAWHRRLQARATGTTRAQHYEIPSIHRSIL